jgi:cellulose synthase/poly-beta-1,6-N-acetylglucosamine synthase-like glycosyltransferase
MEKFSVLIPSYKEKKRLYNLVAGLLRDSQKSKIDKVVVVTPDKNLAQLKSKKILLVEERKRKGKCFAIRQGLSKVRTKIVVMLSSDLRMRKNFLRFLLKHFENSSVGMVIGRPLADKNSKIYPFSKIIWDLHHLLCLKKPKGTEICAFRKVFNHFPKVVTDEVYIEYRLRKSGFSIVYEPEAYGYTRTPSSLANFFKQRKRIFNGHLQMKKEYKYATSSMKFSLVLSLLFQFLKKQPTAFPLLFALICIEIAARVFALAEFLLLRKIELAW